MASHYHSLGPACQLRAFSVDFQHAYKHIPIDATQTAFAHIAVAPPSGDVLVAELRTQPFGSSRAPANWGRVTAFAQWLLSSLFGIYLAKYVDDCYSLEPNITCVTAFHVVKDVCDLLGFKLELRKESPPMTCFNLLGAALTLGDHRVTAALPERRKLDLVCELRSILSANKLSPGRAAKIRGKLGFAQSLLFGRMGRAHLAPLSARQYCRYPIQGWTLDPQLREILSWWIAVIPNAKPRSTPCVGRRPVVVYTDASGKGHIGCVIVDPEDNSRSTFHTHLPTWALERMKILEFELFALILGLVIASETFPGRPLLFFCDNTAANAAIIRGSNKTWMGRCLCSVFWTLATSVEAPVWLEYVNTTINPGDAPSRICGLLPPSLRSSLSVEDTLIPNLFFKVFSTFESLMKTQFYHPGVCEGRSPRISCPCRARAQVLSKTNSSLLIGAPTNTTPLSSMAKTSKFDAPGFIAD